MLEILRVTFPFFALVLCGYAAARLRFLPLEAIPGLNGFVLFFALPCMLFRFGSDTPIAQLLDAGVFFTYLFCVLVIVAFSIAISMNARIRWNDASLGALVAAFPNTGFMGVPLLVALLGAQAVGPAIVTIVVEGERDGAAVCSDPVRASSLDLTRYFIDGSSVVLGWKDGEPLVIVDDAAAAREVAEGRTIRDGGELR